MFQYYQQAADIIKAADALLITAGAGIGVDSGLPDFRGTEGFWKAYPPIAKLGIRFEEMANPYWFEHDPQLAWAFYGHRLNLYRQTLPHKGFEILLNICKSRIYGCFVVTSNVDGQFQKAGFEDRQIEEIHGSIHHLQCSRPCNNNIISAKNIDITIDEVQFKATGDLPICEQCGAVMRPNILMFGDWAWLPERSNQQSRRLYNWLLQVKQNKAKLAIIEFGAGKAVPSIRHKSEMIARQYNATLIRVNPRDYDVPMGHISIPTGALDACENIAKIL